MKSYKQLLVNGKIEREHRVILAKKLDKTLEELGHVDHIDGDIHNNEPDNLREVTPQENSFNTKIYSTNKTGIKGLMWDKVHNNWRGVIMTNGKQRSKSNKDKQVVIDWLESKREELHGEYARR